MPSGNKVSNDRGDMITDLLPRTHARTQTCMYTRTTRTCAHYCNHPHTMCGHMPVCAFGLSRPFACTQAHVRTFMHIPSTPTCVPLVSRCLYTSHTTARYSREPLAMKYLQVAAYKRINKSKTDENKKTKPVCA